MDTQSNRIVCEMRLKQRRVQICQSVRRWLKFIKFFKLSLIHQNTFECKTQYLSPIF